MPLGSKENTTIYLSLSDGKICQRVNADTPDAIEYDRMKNGKPTGEKGYRREFTYIDDVKLVGLFLGKKSTKDGLSSWSEFSLKLYDGDTYYGLGVNPQSAAFNGLVGQLHGAFESEADLEQRMKIRSWKKTNKKGRVNTYLSVSIDGEDVPLKWVTEETKGDAPSLVWNEIKEEWNSDDLDTFIWKKAREVIALFPEDNQVGVNVKEVSGKLEEATAPPESSEEDDMPF